MLPAPYRAKGPSMAEEEDDEFEEEEPEDLDEEDLEALSDDEDEILEDDVLDEDVVEEEDEEEEEEETPDPEERAEGATKVPPKRPDEFVCQSCFLVKHPSQLADAKRQLCRDCV